MLFVSDHILTFHMMIIGELTETPSVYYEHYYSGIYLENLGLAKITNTKWKLITYHDLANYVGTIISVENVVVVVEVVKHSQLLCADIAKKGYF